MDSSKRSVQALDPSSGVWLPARTCGASNGDCTLVKWRDYSEKTSVQNHKIRNPEPKEKCSIDKDLWPNFGHPDKLQRGDLINVKTQPAKEKFLVVEENDPFRAEITSSCGQLLGYSAIVEGTIYSLSHAELNEAGLPLPTVVPPSTTVLSLSSRDNLTSDDRAISTVQKEKEGKQKRKRGKDDKENKRSKSDSRSSQKNKAEPKKQKNKSKEKKARKSSGTKVATSSSEKHQGTEGNQGKGKAKVMVKKKAAEMILVGGGAATGGSSCDKAFTYNSSMLGVGEKELEELLQELQTSGKTVRLASSFWDNPGGDQSNEAATIALGQTLAPEQNLHLEQTPAETATCAQRQAPASEGEEPLPAVPSADPEQTDVETVPLAQKQAPTSEGEEPLPAVPSADPEQTDVETAPLASKQILCSEGQEPLVNGRTSGSTPHTPRQVASPEGEQASETPSTSTVSPTPSADPEQTDVETAPLASKQILCSEGQEPLVNGRTSGSTPHTPRQVASPEGEQASETPSTPTVSPPPSLDLTKPTELPGYLDEDSFADNFSLFELLGDGEQVNDKLLTTVKEMHEDLKIMKSMFKTMLTEMKDIKEALNILPPLQEGPLFSDNVLEVVETESGQYYKVRENVLNDLLPFNSDPPSIARRLADNIFTQEERLNSNVKGVKGKFKLNAAKVFAIRKALEQVCNVQDREKMWAKAVKAIDSASRYLKFKTAV